MVGGRGVILVQTAVNANGIIFLTFIFAHPLTPFSPPSLSVPLSSQICVTKMSTRSGQGKDSVITPLDTIPEDRKVRVQRTQSGFDAFEKPASQVKRVHSENNACISSKASSTGKESPKLRRHSSPSSVSLYSSLHTVCYILYIKYTAQYTQSVVYSLNSWRAAG